MRCYVATAVPALRHCTSVSKLVAEQGAQMSYQRSLRWFSTRGSFAALLVLGLAFFGMLVRFEKQCIDDLHGAFGIGTNVE